MLVCRDCGGELPDGLWPPACRCRQHFAPPDRVPDPPPPDDWVAVALCLTVIVSATAYVVFVLLRG